MKFSTGSGRWNKQSHQPMADSQLHGWADEMTNRCCRSPSIQQWTSTRHHWERNEELLRAWCLEPIGSCNQSVDTTVFSKDVWSCTTIGRHITWVDRVFGDLDPCGSFANTFSCFVGPTGNVSRFLYKLLLCYWQSGLLQPGTWQSPPPTVARSYAMWAVYVWSLLSLLGMWVKLELLQWG